MPVKIEADIDISRVKKWARESPAELDEAFKKGRADGLALIERKLKEQAPVRTGALKSTIKGLKASVKVGTKAIYGVDSKGIAVAWYTNRRPVTWLQIMRNKSYKAFQEKVVKTILKPVEEKVKRMTK